MISRSPLVISPKLVIRPDISFARGVSLNNSAHETATMASLWPLTFLSAVWLASAADPMGERDVGNESSSDVSTILKGLKRPTYKETEMAWHVEGIRKMISKAHSLGPRRQYSDRFVLNGYAAQLSARVDRRQGELWLGLFFALCKGPTDQFLAWPFRTSYTLTLLHPTKEALDISNTISEFSPVTFKNFKRPTDGCNAGRGFPMVIRVSEADEQEYIVDNAVSVRIKLNL
ncbi:TNF receptor-associated factor 2-like [Ornithodoros turicata]|uniref:TNF receptor-associated factor 2-like n=1 Tax=Ornithodoros turicata TaxID=34597 RepID=UPI003138B9D9